MMSMSLLVLRSLGGSLFRSSNAPMVILGVMLALCLTAGVDADMPDEPIKIDTGPQFVHDDHLVDNYWVPGHSRASVDLRFHAPVRYEGNPVLSGLRFSYFSVIRGEDGKYRLWYQLFNPKTVEPNAPKHIPRYGIAYAESDDGLSWTLPELGFHDWDGSKQNNVVWMGIKDDGAAGGFVLTLPEKDSRGFQYAMLYQTHSGMRLVGSRDGIHWDKSSDTLIKRLQSDTFNALAYDPVTRKYFIYCRARNIYRNYEDDKDQGAVRRVAVMSATNLWEEWVDEPSTVMVPNALDAERGFTFYYGMPVRYYGGVFWGFLWPFQMNTIIVTELAFSRNGKDWNRLHGAPRMIEPGPEGQFDDGMVIATTDWIEVGDEWWIYYTGTDGPHNRPRTNNSALGLLKLRKEGFISRYGPPIGGRVCTRTIVWPGGDLQVNAQAIGNLRVRVVTPMRRPIEGFTFEDCDTMAGDSVSHPIRWKGRSLHELAGKDIRLEFELRDAHLYTFRATGEKLNDPRFAELVARLGATSPAATPAAPVSGGSVVGQGAEMEAPEMPGNVSRPVVDPRQMPRPAGQPLIHFDFDSSEGDRVRGKGVHGLTLSLGQSGKSTTRPTLEPHGQGQALRFQDEVQVAWVRVRDSLPESGMLQLSFRPGQKFDASLGIHKYLFQLYGDSKNRDQLIIERGSGRLVFQSLRKDQATVSLRSKAGFEADRWYSVTVVFGPEGSRLYVDGELQDQWGGGFGWGTFRSPTLYIGNVVPDLGPGYSFPGTIDDFRVYGPETSNSTSTPTVHRVAPAAEGNEAEQAPRGETGPADALRSLAMKGAGVTFRANESDSVAFDRGRLAVLKLKGRDLLPTPHEHPLWVLELVAPDSDRIIHIASDGSGDKGLRVSPQRQIEKAGALTAARWEIIDVNGGRAGVVEAWAVQHSEGGIDFHLALDRMNGRFTLRKAWYPQMPLIRLGDDPHDDSLLVPSAYGQIYRDVHARSMGSWGRGSDMYKAVHRTRYPSKFGALQMQFYSDAEMAGGLLMMTPDSERGIKDLVVDRAGADTPLRARFGHHITSASPVRGRVELRYPVRMTWVDGDWYDAGVAYRNWALKQSWAAPDLALGRRSDLPDWFAGLPSWVRIPADPAVPFETKTAWPLQWVEAVGGPMAVHWYGWNVEGGPFNYAFPQYLEPDARFTPMARKYAATDLKVIPYTNARLIDMDVPRIWSKFERSVVRDAKGQPTAVEAWPFYANTQQAEAARAQGKKVQQLKTRASGGQWFHVTHRFAIGWPGSETWRQSITERAMRLFLDHGVDGVYQDQIGVYPLMQHDPQSVSRGEQTGDPLAWQLHEQSLYSELRRDLQAKGVRPLLIGEYLTEAIMPNVVGGLTVSGVGDPEREPVPLWSTVYHTHFAPIGWHDDPSRLSHPPTYLRDRMIPLVWGAQLGWISYTMPELIRRHPSLVEVYRQAVTLRRENPSTLGWGVMQRPPKLEGVEIVQPARENDEAGPQPAILAGFFQDSADASRGIVVFANWTDRPQAATAVMDTSAFTGVLSARRGDGTMIQFNASDAWRLSLSMSPMSIETYHIEKVAP